MYETASVRTAIVTLVRLWGVCMGVIFLTSLRQKTHVKGPSAKIFGPVPQMARMSKFVKHLSFSTLNLKLGNP